MAVSIEFIFNFSKLSSYDMDLYPRNFCNQKKIFFNSWNVFAQIKDLPANFWAILGLSRHLPPYTEHHGPQLCDQRQAAQAARRHARPRRLHLNSSHRVGPATEQSLPIPERLVKFFNVHSWEWEPDSQEPQKDAGDLPGHQVALFSQV